MEILKGERQRAPTSFRKALFAEIGRFIEEVAEDLERGAKRFEQPLNDAGIEAETIVAVAFTVGGEALDLPKHHRGGTQRTDYQSDQNDFAGSARANRSGDCRIGKAKRG